MPKDSQYICNELKLAVVCHAWHDEVGHEPKLHAKQHVSLKQICWPLQAAVKALHQYRAIQQALTEKTAEYEALNRMLSNQPPPAV